jgi:nucleoside-diphosphate kinase
LKLALISQSLAEKHYEVHRGKPFYASLLHFMTSGPVVILALQGNRAIDVARKMMGKTFGHQAEPGTIRGDYGLSSQFNLIHGSDSPESADKELKLFFSQGELVESRACDSKWLMDE